MKTTLSILRWFTLVVCIIWGLLQLNGAIYAAWAATGPPSPNPEGWLFVAGNRLAWAIASFLAGAGLFFLLRQGRPSKFALAAIAAATALTALPYAREFITSDSCLDSGGKWSELRCMRE